MDREEKKESLKNAALAGASADVVQRYGAAVKAHAAAYSGVDNETGEALQKGLKGVSAYKVNPDYEYQNRKQQAGFSAETKTVARDNAEKAIQGDNTTKSTRTDDMRTQSDGKGGKVGGTNDQMYDVAETDASGKYVQGSGRQLKFVGKSADECYTKLMSKDYDKYRDADTPIEVPADYYEGVQEKLAKRAEDLKKQIANAEEKGNTELAEKHREQLERVEKTQKTLRKGNTTSKEAMFARDHPMLSTAVDMTKVAHRGGMEAAKSGAVVGGSVSIVQNLVACVRGEKEPGEAVLDVAKDTGTAAAVSYGTGFVGSGLKGLMQNAKLETFRNLSKTNLPGTIVTVAIGAGKTMKKYFSGDIDGVECLEELGEQGTGMIASGLFATIGQLAIPIPVVGGIVGGMLGYAVASASYGILTSSLKEAKLAHEERLRIEQECEKTIALIREYRLEVEKTIDQYLSSYINVFQTSFDRMKNALELGDVDGFISGANSISQAMGSTPQFQDKKGFDMIMASENAFKL